MIIILAIDALEYSLVEEFDCKNLKQKFYGKTNISIFTKPRTIVLWSSFMTGKNMESEILAKGDKEMWNTKINFEDTFFRHFKSPRIIDLPGFNYDKKQHDLEREMLKSYFDAKSDNEKNDIRAKYNEHAFNHYKKIKQEFESALKGNYDMILCYFSIADVIGHLNFGNKTMMKMTYKDLDEIAGLLNKTFIVLSDHGMKGVGIFGDHSNHGFWSTNFKDLKEPKITEFANIIKKLGKTSV